MPTDSLSALTMSSSAEAKRSLKHCKALNNEEASERWVQVKVCMHLCALCMNGLLYDMKEMTAEV